MTDYKLTPAEQSQLIQFLNDNKAIYLEGNDFGYYHKSDAIYKMFGCTWLGDGAGSNNVAHIDGERSTLADGVKINYTKGSAYPDQYVDDLGNGNGGTYFFKGDDKLGKVVSYTGVNGTYRAIHSSIWFGALKNAGATHTKKQLMAAYMRYLEGHALVKGADAEISAATGGSVGLSLVTPVAQANRTYGILGSVSGTTPGFPAGSVNVPLNFDVFTKVAINLVNTPIFKNFYAQLDGSGMAHAIFDTVNPLDSSLVGVSFYYAFLLTDPMIDFASNPVQITVVP